MTRQELQAILTAHSLYLREEKNGTRANLYRANLYRADLSGADLSGANLSGANLSSADLSGADLSLANLYHADLSRANLYRANLYRADLSLATLYRADLSLANLSHADLSRANLSHADLSRANLIVGGQRSDGHQFFAIREPSHEIKIRAGCRYFSIEDARDHWSTTRKDTRLGNESLAIVDHLKRMARIAGWFD